MAANIQNPLASSTVIPARSATSESLVLAVFPVATAFEFTQLGEYVDHVYGNANRPSLVGDRPCDRLTDPPGGVCRELKPTSILVFVDGTHQPRVPS